LLTGMSWSCLRDTQEFGMQCVIYIHHWIALRPGIMVASHQPFSQLPSSCRGLLPFKSRLLSCPSYGSFLFIKTRCTILWIVIHVYRKIHMCIGTLFLHKNIIRLSSSQRNNTTKCRIVMYIC
jgi:hypothetical protein